MNTHSDTEQTMTTENPAASTPVQTSGHLDVAAVAALTGLGITQIRHLSDGLEFPLSARRRVAPDKIAVVWSRAEVEAWMARRADALHQPFCVACAFIVTPKGCEPECSMSLVGADPVAGPIQDSCRRARRPGADCGPAGALFVARAENAKPAPPSRYLLALTALACADQDYEATGAVTPETMGLIRDLLKPTAAHA
jgi:predicted DNA-binding transcriptional regulator AlpA